MPRLRWSREVDFPVQMGITANARQSILSGSLSFLNRREMVGFPPDWKRADLPLLWLYNLHYHEFLWQLDFEQAREVVQDWVANHGPGTVQMGWEAYPTSLRLANWCMVFFGRYRAQTLRDEQFCAALWASICDQAEHLRRNLEWHLLGNHLLENAVALALVGSCFAHPVAEAWFEKGCAILDRGIARADPRGWRAHRTLADVPMSGALRAFAFERDWRWYIERTGETVSQASGEVARRPDPSRWRHRTAQRQCDWHLPGAASIDEKSRRKIAATQVLRACRKRLLRCPDQRWELYHLRLRGHWPGLPARAWACRFVLIRAFVARCAGGGR